MPQCGCEMLAKVCERQLATIESLVDKLCLLTASLTQASPLASYMQANAPLARPMPQGMPLPNGFPVPPSDHESIDGDPMGFAGPGTLPGQLGSITSNVPPQ